MNFKYIKYLFKQKTLFYLLFIGLVLPNLFLVFTENVSILTRICNLLLPSSAFLFLCTLNKKPGKMVWWLFIFIFFAAFELVLLRIFGNSVIAVDMFLNVVKTNAGEATELLDNILAPVLAVILYYGEILVLSIFSIKNKKVLSHKFISRNRMVSIVVFAIAAVFTVINLILDSRFSIVNDIYPVNVSYNFGLAIDREIMANKYFDNVEDFKFNSHYSHQAEDAEVYVFVICETSRALNWGLYGYERNTTPLLNEIKDELYVYRDALTQSNTTHKSVPMLLSAVDASNFNDIYSQRSIITAFKEAGYSTYFISNQRRNHSLIDFFGEEADQTIFIKDNLSDTANVYDEKIIPLLQNALSDTLKTKKFIVLHTYGSHCNYSDRYPDSMRRFQPDVVPSAELKYRDNMVNAFDNTIVYTDYVVRKVIDAVKATNVAASVIYTSDHGEDIFDDERKMFLHASPIPTIYQIYVPCIVWTSERYNDIHPENCRNMIMNIDKPIATSRVAFHTLLSMAGIVTDYSDDTNSLASESFTIKHRDYLNDHNDPVPLNEIGLIKSDFDLMDKLHLCKE